MPRNIKVIRPSLVAFEQMNVNVGDAKIEVVCGDRTNTYEIDHLTGGESFTIYLKNNTAYRLVQRKGQWSALVLFDINGKPTETYTVVSVDDIPGPNHREEFPLDIAFEKPLYDVTIGDGAICCALPSRVKGIRTGRDRDIITLENGRIITMDKGRRCVHSRVRVAGMEAKVRNL